MRHCILLRLLRHMLELRDLLVRDECDFFVDARAAADGGDGDVVPGDFVLEHHVEWRGCRTYRFRTQKETNISHQS